MSHTIHIAAVAYNSVFLGEFMQPDWDMFHSDHPAAEYHGSARAISGGPIYVRYIKLLYGIVEQLIIGYNISDLTPYFVTVMHLESTTLIYLGSLFCLMDQCSGPVCLVDLPVIACSMIQLEMVLGMPTELRLLCKYNNLTN